MGGGLIHIYGSIGQIRPMHGQQLNLGYWAFFIWRGRIAWKEQLSQKECKTIFSMDSGFEGASFN